ncbi:MAG: hypothetical protein MRZ83_07810 [Prevotella sp.]|nr:hypothetical protein [Prevotella sp.]
MRNGSTYARLIAADRGRPMAVFCALTETPGITKTAAGNRETGLHDAKDSSQRANDGH